MSARVCGQPVLQRRSGCSVESITKRSSHIRAPRLVVRASQSSASISSDQVDNAVKTLQLASKSSSTPSTDVFQALRTLEKAKLPTETWPSIIGGTVSPGRRWKLVFTSGTKEVQQAMKGIGKGGGRYFPLTAVQRWDASQGQIENGIFLGHVAALTFRGPYLMQNKKLSFDFDTLCLKLGPGRFEFKLKDKIVDYKPSPKDPFFLFFYVDENVIAARGRSGGIAFWSRTTPQWELENGVA